MTGNKNFNASQHFLMNATTSRGTEWYFETRVLSRYRSVFYGSRGLEVSLSADLCVSSLQFFADGSRSLGFVVFVCPFGLQKSNFFRVNRYIAYPTNRLRKFDTRQRSILMGFR